MDFVNKFRDFSVATTDLKASIPKYKIYYGGVNDVTKLLIQEETEFDTGSMPFKYLRVPLTSRKLLIAMCQPLIEKMLERLNHWSTRLLSYASRMQLVKNVLFVIANCWMQIFPLPKKVRNHVESICRIFLWTGKDSPSKNAHVSWEHMCEPKNQTVNIYKNSCKESVSFLGK